MIDFHPAQSASHGLFKNKKYNQCKEENKYRHIHAHAYTDSHTHPPTHTHAETYTFRHIHLGCTGTLSQSSMIKENKVEMTSSLEIRILLERMSFEVGFERREGWTVTERKW